MNGNRLILYANYIYRKNLGWGSCNETKIGVLKDVAKSNAITIFY